MKSADQQILRDAISRNAGIVISLPSAGMLRHCKSRLLASDENGFWIQAPPDETSLVNELMTSRQPIGISLKSATNKVVFTTIILQLQSAMQINKETTVNALMLVWPEELKAVQRRADYRVTVLPDAEISVRTWRITEHHYLKDRPPAVAQFEVTLRDLSVGGMGVVCAFDPVAPKLTPDQRLRAVITHPDGELLLEGRVKHIRTLPNGDLKVGVSFKKLEDGIEGRQALASLTQVVGQLQRDEIRRRRISMPRGA
jgi:c-di-GMP-binding flagellar brake protein YcgR